MSGTNLQINKAELERHLRQIGFSGATISELEALGPAARSDLKALGYGRPVRARFHQGKTTREIVFRTLAPDQFGHDRRADRFGQVVLAIDSFGRFPEHVAALDAGAIDEHGRLISFAGGEPYLITEYVEGDLYARDLGEIAERGHARPIDLERARVLAEYLLSLHSERAPAAAYTRSIRDTIGSGEGIFGIADSYPADDPIATPQRLEAIETAAVHWRYKLRGFSHRARCTHGDFHPFNILFREGSSFSVLDASRGAAGDPADDVACLSINYAFFALVKRGAFIGALREVWNTFWNTYLERSRDQELTRVVAPFFAWRTLVLANPLWYPAVPLEARDRLLAFAELLLAEKTFDPAMIEELL